jgi:actin-related protein
MGYEVTQIALIEEQKQKEKVTIEVGGLTVVNSLASKLSHPGQSFESKQEKELLSYEAHKYLGCTTSAQPHLTEQKYELASGDEVTISKELCALCDESFFSSSSNLSEAIKSISATSKVKDVIICGGPACFKNINEKLQESLGSTFHVIAFEEPRYAVIRGAMSMHNKDVQWVTR